VYLSARMQSSESVQKRAMASKTLEEFVQQTPPVPDLLAGIRDVLTGIPGEYRQLESYRRAQASVEELRRRVAEQWNPSERIPQEYRNSLAVDFWMLREIAGRLGSSGGLGLRPRAADSTLSAVADDLEIKLETCRQAGKGLGGKINIRVNTLQGGAPVKGLQVFFVSKIFESEAEKNAEPFPMFSSPTENKLAPGRYLFWSRDPATHRNGERMIVRASGVQDIGVDLPVPK
jgi:hypothetical protein